MGWKVAVYTNPPSNKVRYRWSTPSPSFSRPLEALSQEHIENSGPGFNDFVDPDFDIGSRRQKVRGKLYFLVYFFHFCN
jgi:hypothetical protein